MPKAKSKTKYTIDAASLDSSPQLSSKKKDDLYLFLLHLMCSSNNNIWARFNEFSWRPFWILLGFFYDRLIEISRTSFLAAILSWNFRLRTSNYRSPHWAFALLNRYICRYIMWPGCNTYASISSPFIRWGVCVVFFLEGFVYRYSPSSWSW